MKNGAYWKKRFKQIEESQHQQGLQCYADIEKQYLAAQRQMEAQINAWYQRFADNNGISLVEAHRLLHSGELDELKWTVEQYIKYGKENAINGQWIKELENASAKAHISRLESLKLQLQQSLEVLFGNQLDSVDAAVRDIYQSGFLRTAYEIQKGIGVGWTFASLNDRLIEKVIHKPWAADGQMFSDRIWSNKQKLVHELNTTLTQNIITGADPQKTIDALARKMNVSKQNAGRLVMTEQAAFSNAAQKDCFVELGVEQFEVIETLDSTTCSLCGSMDGQHFPMSQYEIGVTAPPFHPNCRGCTCPYFDDDFGVPGERAARGEDGKTYYVPADMTYEEWKKSFAQDGGRNDKNPVANTSGHGIMKLSAEEKAALQNYKSFESYKINDLLRKTEKLTDLSAEQQKFINNLDSALLKIPKYKGNLQRTVDFSDWTDAEEKTKKFIEEFTKGDKIRIPQYWSTSSKKGYNDAAGIHIFIENAEKGRDIRAIGLNESEVLYERNSEFIVVEKIFADGKWNILLKEV